MPRTRTQYSVADPENILGWGDNIDPTSPTTSNKGLLYILKNLGGGGAGPYSVRSATDTTHCYFALFYSLSVLRHTSIQYNIVQYSTLHVILHYSTLYYIIVKKICVHLAMYHTTLHYTIYYLIHYLYTTLYYLTPDHTTLQQIILYNIHFIIILYTIICTVLHYTT